MSSSDLASPDRAAVSDELNSAEENDSLDASLDAILSEAKEGTAEPLSHGDALASATAETLDLPAAEVQMALAEPSTQAPPPHDGIDDDLETPLPVIVDDTAGYQAFAEAVAPAAVDDVPAQAAVEEPATAEATASPYPEEVDEIEAESLVESTTPSPVMADPEALVATQETSAYPAPPRPPTDEEILAHVVLPAGRTPMPLFSSSLDDEEDRTVISPMPPIPEAAPTIQTPRTVWAQTDDATAPIMLSARYPAEGLTDKVRKVVGARVQTSVGMLAFVVVAASALGGVVVKMASSPAPVTVTAAPEAQATTETAVASAPKIAPLPALPALPSATPAAPVVADKAKPGPRVAVPSTPRPATPTTRIALAAPKPTAAPKPAAAVVPSAAAKPKKPAQSANWVDPFGQ